MENKNFMSLTEDELYDVNGGGKIKDILRIMGTAGGVLFGLLVTPGYNDHYDPNSLQSTICNYYAYQFSGGAYGSNGSKQGYEKESNTTDSNSSSGTTGTSKKGKKN